MKNHLDRCSSCRDALQRRIIYVREYAKRTRDPDVIAIAETITEGIVSQKESKILHFCPYDDEDEDKHRALAARTESTRAEQPLRYVSDDEELLLRSFPDEATGAEAFYLTGNDPRFVRNATVIFKGKHYTSDSKGRVDFGEDARYIDEESEFIIIKRTPDLQR